MPSFTPNTKFSITGENLNFISEVKFGDLTVDDLEYVDATGLSGSVPAGAYTQEIKAITSHGEFSLGTPFVILGSNDQVSVGNLSTVSGEAGGILNITGENFYQITNVKFGDVESDFQVVDSGTIEVTVPQDADYSGITVFSSVRTGLNNNQTIPSGLSLDEFFPVPEVSGLSSYQLCSGESLSITGFSLSGVTGVKFADNVSLLSGVSLSPNTIEVTIPSGNIRGVPTLLLPSGAEKKIDDSFTLSPLAKITGVGNSPVGISTNHPEGSTGTLIIISGENFASGILYPTGENYLGTIMGETGEFKLINHQSMSGMIPTGIPIVTSGGNVGISPTIESGVVSLFSDNYPQSYPSETFFTPSIGLPKISNIDPASGVAGDVISIKGTDLYSLTGVNLLASANSNVGVGTYSAGTIAEVIPGYEVSFEIGNAVTLGSNGEFYDVVLSGHYGSVTGTSGLFSFGTPFVSGVTPSTEISPGATGLMSGRCLYSGTTVEMWTGQSAISTYKFYRELPASGYDNTNYNNIEFTYPNEFLTGVGNYKVRARNRRGLSSITTAPIVVGFKTPTLSGFSPLSGEYGDEITVSGFFENIVESGLFIGGVNIDSFSQPSSTGFTFTLPKESHSDTLLISTSGGQLSSTGVLGVTPSKPAISGFYSGITPPENINYEQVFTDVDDVTISGERLHLVTGIQFSGETGTFEVSSFLSQTYSTIMLDVPPVNPASGKFKLLDFAGRETESNETGIRILEVSGFDNYLLPGEDLKMSGYNISGVSALFNAATGITMAIPPASNTISGDLEIVTFQVPTGISYGTLTVSGRENISTLNTNESFYPLGVVTGISGLSGDLTVETGATFRITGINAFDDFFLDETGSLSLNVSGFPLLGISGSGVGAEVPSGMASTVTESQEVLTQFSIKSYETGSGVIGGVAGTFYSVIEVEAPAGELISGEPFIIDPWWNLTPDSEIEDYNVDVLGISPGGVPPRAYDRYSFPTGGDIASSNLQKKLTAGVDNKIKITGVHPFVSGFFPVRGAAGTKVLLSGSGLNFIDEVNLVNTSSSEFFPCVFSGTELVLEMEVPQASRDFVGDNILSLRGQSCSNSFAQHVGYTASGVRTGAISGQEPLSTFEYLLAAEAIDNQVVPSGFEEPEPESDRTVNYTVEEIVNGVPFLITKTKFPDGSTLVVSSIPKP